MFELMLGIIAVLGVISIYLALRNRELKKEVQMFHFANNNLGLEKDSFELSNAELAIDIEQLRRDAETVAKDHTALEEQIKNLKLTLNADRELILTLEDDKAALESKNETLEDMIRIIIKAFKASQKKKKARN